MSFHLNNLFCNIGIIKAKSLEHVKKTYTFEINARYGLDRFIEKPREPFNMVMGTRNVIFNRKVFEFIQDVPINKTRREKELVDLFMLILKKQYKIGLFCVGDKYVNVNTLEDLSMARNLLCPHN